MTPCSSDFVLDAAFGDALDPEAQRALDQHLLECSRCSSRRQLLAGQRAQFLSAAQPPRHGARSALREPLSARPRGRWRSLRVVMMVGLGALWLVVGLRATQQSRARARHEQPAGRVVTR
jgi:hypothetical protein